MSNVPFYLSNDVSASQGDILFSIPIYTNPQPQGVVYTPTQMESVWNSLAETGSGVVSSVKETVSGALGSVTSTIGGTMGSFFDEIRTNLIYMVLLFVLLIWVIAKSGILKQAAPIAKAFI